MRWTSYRSATCSGTLTLHFTSCTLKRWHAAPTKGQAPRHRLQCSPVIGMTASQQPNSHRDTGPDPRGWAPVTGSRYSRSGPLSRPESSPGQRLRRGPTLEVEKTCSQEKSSSWQRRRRRPGDGDSRQPPIGSHGKAGQPTQDQSSRQCMSVRQTMLQGTGPGPIGATRHTRVVARNVAATLSRLTGRSRASGLRPSEITRQRSRRPPTIALHRNN